MDDGVYNLPMKRLSLARKRPLTAPISSKSSWAPAGSVAEWFGVYS